MHQDDLRYRRLSTCARLAVTWLCLVLLSVAGAADAAPATEGAGDNPPMSGSVRNIAPAAGVDKDARSGRLGRSGRSGSINHITNYRDARRALPVIFSRLEQPLSLYCGCTLHFTRRHRRVGYYPDLQECGYEIRENEERATRFESEHIVPASMFGRQMQCWRQSGRSGCSQGDPYFMLVEGDLHNLYPVIGEVNSDRSNYPFSEWDDKAQKMYGRCQTIVDSEKGRVQPRPQSRGIIARAGLYMHKRYEIGLDSAQRRLFNRWNAAYPPKFNECKRNELIAYLTGNDNIFVTEACAAQGITVRLSREDHRALDEFLLLLGK